MSTCVGFGCAGLMRVPSQRGRQELLAEAFDRGIRHFDVARMYGLGVAEAELGNFANGRRDDVIIATKFGIEASAAPGRLGRFQGPARRLLARYPALRSQVKRRSSSFHSPHCYDRATARASLETSLRELRTDYVDILLVHDPSPTDHVDLSEICDYLEEARTAGLLRAWGVAGEPVPCIELKHSFPQEAILQVRHDIFSTEPLAPDRLEPLITFGVIGEALNRIRRYLSAHPGRRDDWSRSMGLDCASEDTIVALLLEGAQRANPRGVVLFSTTKPERLKACVSGRPLVDDDSLTIFMQQLSTELAA